MNYLHDNALHKINLFSGMLSTAYRIDSWCYGRDDKPYLFQSSNEHSQILQSFLEISGAMDYIYNVNYNTSKPVFFSDTLGCVWLGEWIGYEEDYNNLLFVIGPVMYGANSTQNLARRLQNLHYSKALQDTLLSITKEIPVLEPTTFISMGIMMHFVLTGEEIGTADCIFQNAHTAGKNQDDDELFVATEQSEQAAEELLMRIVREGDVEGAKKFHDNRFLGRPLELGIYDPMREMQDTLIMFVVLCSRAAMQGGLPPKIARNMVKKYISAVETTRIPTALTDLSRNMYLEFTQRVRDARQQEGVSRRIQDCCAYIQANLTRELTLKELASEIGYSEYYLTKKFYAEMGIKLSDYIKQKRIDYAKILLRTTDKGVQEISNLLCFSSRNYFSTVFQTMTGITPAAYRVQCAGKEEKNETKK